MNPTHEQLEQAGSAHRLICPECKRPAIEDHNSFWCDHCRRLWPKGSGHELYVSEVPRGPAVEDRHNPAHAVFTLEELNQYYEPCSKPTKNSKTTHGDFGNAPQK